MKAISKSAPGKGAKGGKGCLLTGNHVVFVIWWWGEGGGGGGGGGGGSCASA